MVLAAGSWSRCLSASAGVSRRGSDQAAAVLVHLCGQKVCERERESLIAFLQWHGEGGRGIGYGSVLLLLQPDYHCRESSWPLANQAY